MQKYEVKEFNIPKLKGISEKNIQEHLGLYKGYVNNTNMILETLADKNSTNSDYAKSEMQRRLSFEFNGMRNHEYYFESLSDGPQEIDTTSELYKKIVDQFGDFESWLENFKTLGKTRGIGWAMMYYDKNSDQLIHAWIDEQHLGQLNGLHPILCLDMWEHSFVFDYQPSGKGDYINDFFENLNWTKIQENYNQAVK